jgi:superfamily I DNA/RNA helicase
MYFKDLLGAISRAKDDLISPEEYRAAADAMARQAATPESVETAERAHEAATVYAAYQAALEERGDADYADLIAKMGRLLRDEPQTAADMRARYEHILVDEFQDINYAMGALLRELAGRRGALWAVGDVDQAIYRFRGASPANLLRFTRDFDGAQVIPLGRNYRSRPQILQAASAFASAYLPGEQRLALEATRSEADGSPAPPAVVLATAPDGEAELDGLAQTMRDRVAAGTPLREQAVLLRTRGYVKQVCEGLRARGVPAQLAAPLLEQPLIKTLLATVSLAVDPLAIGLLRAGALPDHTFSDDDARTALRLAREQHVTPLEASRSDEARSAMSPAGYAGLRRLERVIAQLRSAPSVAVGLSRYIFSLTALGLRLLGDDARVEAAQVARLLEICRAFDDQRTAGALLGAGDAAPLMADWAGLLDYISALRELGHEAGAIGDTSAVDAALVLTAHGGKGLEFPVVYLPQLARNRFPAPARRQAIPAPPGLLRDADESGADDLIEEASAFYVALTRARDTLVLSYADRYGKRAYTPSPFLAPIEQELGAELARLRWEGAATSGEPAADVAAEPDAEPEDEQQATADAQAAQTTISLSQLEAYQRCPQQYAYQYVYGLWPTLAPFVSLRAALQGATAEVSERFAAGEPPTLEEALGAFHAHWSAARRDALHQGAAKDPAERDETLAAVYHLHGERAIERLWRDLGRDPQPVVARESSAIGEGAAVVASVTLAGTTITGALDHVEQAAAATRATGSAATQPAGRVIRLAPGKLDNTMTLRDLFYALAAEEMRQEGRAVEVVRVSLASGEAKPLKVSATQRKRIESEANAALVGLARESYPPRPDARTCPTCPFALICPA